VHTVLEIEVINGGSIVIDNHKLVDTAEVADQCGAEVRLNPTDEIIRAQQLGLRGLGFCDSHRYTL